jgi:glutaredoxin
MSKLKSIHVVYADWCPHCVPTTVEPLKKKAEEIGVRYILYNIDDPDALNRADDLVKRYGDWSEDYLVPQVFIEYDNGDFKHVFTGYSEDIELTRTGLSNLLKSRLLS